MNDLSPNPGLWDGKETVTNKQRGTKEGIGTYALFTSANM